MRFHPRYLLLCLIAATASCTHLHEEAANPMSPFARLIGGEWKMMGLQGERAIFDVWHWGPGRHSLRVMTDGIGGDLNPWRELAVVYWHPGRKEIRSLRLSTYGAGVAEGVVTFDGQTLQAVTDMYQLRNRRQLKSIWKFDWPDKYRDELFEANSAGEYSLLMAWDRQRIAARASHGATSRAVEPPLEVSEKLKPFEPLLHRTWETTGEATGQSATKATTRFRTRGVYVPLANGIYVRTLAFTKDAQPLHALDVYIYHHTGANALRCLALAHDGAVYEGDVTVLEGGALQFEMKGYQADRIVPIVARIDFENDGTLRHRIWSDASNGDRTLMLDVVQKPAPAHHDDGD